MRRTLGLSNRRKRCTRSPILAMTVLDEVPLNSTSLPWSYPSPLRAWWAIAVFCFAAVISYTDRLILSALVDPIKHTLGLTDSTVSLLQGAAFALVYVLSGLLLGRLADQKRRLTILIIGSTLWCAGTAAGGLAPSFAVLFLTRVIVGIGEASLAPAAASMIADMLPSARRGTGLGIFLLGTVLGGPAAIAVGALLLSMGQSGAFRLMPLVGALDPWRAVLVLVGILGLAVPALFLTLQEPARREAAAAVSIRSMLTRLAADRQSLIPTYVAMALMTIGDYATWAWVPSLLARRFSMPSGELGAAFGAITAVAGVLGCVLGGLGSDTLARRYGVQGRLFFSVARR